MEGKTRYISLCNQKGGTGKSTLTVLAASWLRYVQGLNVAVVDCDYPQYSIIELREREKSAVMEHDAYKLLLQRQYERLQRKAWPVVRSTQDKALDDVRIFLEGETEAYDVVLFDLPGTINTSGVLYVISAMDFLFVPTRVDRLVMQSTINFALTINEKFVGNPATDLRGLYLFFNMEDRRERTMLYETYEKLLSRLHLPMLSTRIQSRSKFGRELADANGIVYRSTLLKSDTTFLRESGFEALMRQICKILELTDDQ